jgi:membrane-associated protein
MDYSTFIAYNALGGITWCTAFIGAGYILGNILPESGDILTLIILGITIVSLIPIGTEAYKRMGEEQKRKQVVD